MDRWYGTALGAPLLVDLLDCDVLLPAGYEVVPDREPAKWPIEPSFVCLTEHLKLSILIGRVLKTIYSPTGLKHATDEQLYAILEDMKSWKDNLPAVVQFRGPESSHAAGESHAHGNALTRRPAASLLYGAPVPLLAAIHASHLHLPAAPQVRPRSHALVRHGAMVDRGARVACRERRGARYALCLSVHGDELRVDPISHLGAASGPGVAREPQAGARDGAPMGGRRAAG
jgi:hypothetical protein